MSVLSQGHSRAPHTKHPYLKPGTPTLHVVTSSSAVCRLQQNGIASAAHGPLQARSAVSQVPLAPYMETSTLALSFPNPTTQAGSGHTLPSEAFRKPPVTEFPRQTPMARSRPGFVWSASWSTSPVISTGLCPELGGRDLSQNTYQDKDCPPYSSPPESLPERVLHRGTTSLGTGPGKNTQSPPSGSVL